MRVSWRNRRNTKTPTKAFDVSDVRRLTLEHQAVLPAELVTARPARATTQH